MWVWCPPDPALPSTPQHHLPNPSHLSPAAAGSQSRPDPGFLICPGCHSDYPMGARALLADVEGMCALLGPKLISAQTRVTDPRDRASPWAGLAAGPEGPVREHEPKRPLPPPLRTSFPVAACLSPSHIPLTPFLPTWPSITRPHTEPLKSIWEENRMLSAVHP